MQKKNIYLSIIFTILFASTICFNSNSQKTVAISEKQTENEIIIPKSSEIKINLLRTFTSTGLQTVSISANGSYIAVGSTNDVKLFNKGNSAKLWNYTTPTYPTPIISSSGEYIIAKTSNTDNQIYLFNKSASLNKTPMWNYTFSSSISSVSISPLGNYIVAGSGDNVTLFDKGQSSNKKPVWELNRTNSIIRDVTSVAMSADSNYIAAGHGTNITFINRATGIIEWTYDTTDTLYTSNQIDISYDGRYIVATHGINMSYFDTTVKTRMWSYENDPGYIIKQVDMCESGEYMIAKANYAFKAGIDSETALFNSSKTNPKSKVWKYGKSMELATPKISADGNYSVVGYTGAGSTHNISMLNRSDDMNNKLLWSYDLPAQITSVGISAVGDYIVAGCTDDKVYLFSSNIPSYSGRLLALVDDDDDDDDDIEAIPFGNFYLVFVAIGVIALIIIQKRKVIFNKK